MKNWMAAITLGALVLAGCKESATDPETGKAVLRIYLTDAVAQYDAVNITFTEVSAHIDSAWLVLNNQTQTVNLLDWNNGKTLLLGQAEVEAGKYTQIRLKMQDASVVWNGQTFPMNVPSGAQSGLKLLTNFDVAVGSTYDLVLDFDAERSVVVNGPRSKPTGFKLKPTIRAAAVALTGSISGTVSNPAHLPTAYAIANNDTVTSSFVDPASGFFRLAFLPPQSYTVVIADTTGKSFAKAGVVVVAGRENAIGNISLQ